MPNCPNCGQDHALDDKLITVTLPKLQWEAILSLSNLGIVNMSPEVSMNERIKAALTFATNHKQILLETLPGLVCIAREAGMDEELQGFFSSLLDHMRGKHEH